jgi:hypothetical protein
MTRQRFMELSNGWFTPIPRRTSWSATATMSYFTPHTTTRTIHTSITPQTIFHFYSPIKYPASTHIPIPPNITSTQPSHTPQARLSTPERTVHPYLIPIVNPAPTSIKDATITELTSPADLICAARSSINGSNLTVINSHVHQNSCLDFPTAVVISLQRSPHRNSPQKIRTHHHHHQHTQAQHRHIISQDEVDE